MVSLVSLALTTLLVTNFATAVLDSIVLNINRQLHEHNDPNNCTKRSLSRQAKRLVTVTDSELLNDNEVVATFKFHGRRYYPKFSEDGKELTRKECLKVGEWFPHVAGGTCWRQYIPPAILKRSDYCPLYQEQTRKACIAKGCEWHPKSVWRCYKTPELMEKEAVRDVVYYGSDGETRFIAFKDKDTVKAECEADGGIWIPLPDWKCWVEIYVTRPAAEESPEFSPSPADKPVL